MVRILYFAGLREALQCSGESVSLPGEVRTVGELRHWLAAREARWAPLGTMKNLRIAVNQAMVEPQSPVVAGDEVAFFPPVTGG